MTELSFLIELLLNHKLQKVTKDAIAERIKEASGPNAIQQHVPNGVRSLSPMVAMQSPSTQAILDRNPDLVVPIESVGQTPAAQAAIASRQQAIAQALSGKPEKGQTSPRKF